VEMMVQHRAPRKTLLFVLILAFMIGCSQVRSQSDVIGEYELKVKTGRIELQLSPDGIFSETIFRPTGKVENRRGKWLWAEQGISFDQLWIPPEFAPDYILQADASANANKQPKYTEAGHWFIRPEKHWGSIILPIFPDADVMFKMVRGLRR